jgi:hypothetical protein
MNSTLEIHLTFKLSVQTKGDLSCLHLRKDKTLPREIESTG